MVFSQVTFLGSEFEHGDGSMAHPWCPHDRLDGETELGSEGIDGGIIDTVASGYSVDSHERSWSC